MLNFDGDVDANANANVKCEYTITDKAIVSKETITLFDVHLYICCVYLFETLHKIWFCLNDIFYIGDRTATLQTGTALSVFRLLVKIMSGIANVMIIFITLCKRKINYYYYWSHSFLQHALYFEQSRQCLSSFLLFTNIASSICTPWRYPITSDDVREFKITCTNDVAMSRNECHHYY